MEERVILNKYRIVKLLSNGSGGEVFLAEHKVLSEYRVIKRLDKNLPFFEERKKEAHILKQLHHPSIPVVYDIEEDETSMYLIEEYMGGETLKDFLSRKQILPQSLILYLSIQLCEVLEYLHKSGFLYLDMKPDNLMLNGDLLAIIDFGAAIRKDKPPVVIFGTDGFAAPEQSKGHAEQRSDVFGIGCVIGEMISNSNCGKELRRIYENCVQHVPENRIRDVTELKEKLNLLYNGKKKGGNEKRGKEVRYIGVVGVHEGADSLAFCFQLAVFFREREQGRIACIEKTGEDKHREMFHGVFGEQRHVPEAYDICQISFFSGQSTGMEECGANGFSVVITNFGYPFEGKQEEFYRCDLHFAVGNLYPWNYHSFKALVRLFKEKFLSERLIVILNGGDSGELPVRVAQCHSIPEGRDVLKPGKQTEHLLEKIIRNF